MDFGLMLQSLLRNLEVELFRCFLQLQIISMLDLHLLGLVMGLNALMHL